MRFVLDVEPSSCELPNGCSQTVWLGANDACLADSTTKQYVPLGDYRANLTSIIEIVASSIKDPRKIILITPPPVDEYVIESKCAAMGVTQRQRTAEHTKMYADAARDLGKIEGIVVLDMWSVYMQWAGWKEGETLLGSKSCPQSKELSELMHDGK